MPTEQRLGLHEEPPSPNGREETAQAREHGPIRWPEGRACDLAAQHRDLVTEDDDLDRQLLLLAKGETDQLEEANERHVEERESHDSIFTVRTTPTKVQFDGLDDVFGTDTLVVGPSLCNSYSALISSADNARFHILVPETLPPARVTPPVRANTTSVPAALGGTGEVTRGSPFMPFAFRSR